jgi:glycosyltransferase involved in cell wall biosynthesis
MSHVAIIVPAYAEADRLAAAVRCAQEQTHAPGSS